MKTIVILVFFVISHFAYCAKTADVWGPTGHRVVGEIAEKYLNRKTRRQLRKLLDGKSLAFVSNFADNIKSDPDYQKYNSWHYVNFPYGKKYKDAKWNPKGDLVMAIRKCIAVLKDKNTPKKDKVFYVKMLIHFIGDLHQPLHVGNAEDRGGNDIQLQWFGKVTNLHRLWDEHMIDHYRMSYTELANSYPKLSTKKRKELQKGDVMQWLYESRDLAEKKVYPSAKQGDKTGYSYNYRYFPLVREQLQKAGLRLAKILNDIFGR